MELSKLKRDVSDKNVLDVLFEHSIKLRNLGEIPQFMVYTNYLQCL